MFQEIRTRTLLLSEDHDKRDKVLLDKRKRQLVSKGWEQTSEITFVKRITVKE